MSGFLHMAYIAKMMEHGSAVSGYELWMWRRVALLTKNGEESVKAESLLDGGVVRWLLWQTLKLAMMESSQGGASGQPWEERAYQIVLDIIMARTKLLLAIA